MLYDVEQIADLTKVSSATIYRKIKLKEIEPFLVKKQGKTYVTEDGLCAIAKIINANIDENEPVNYKNIEDFVSADTIAFDEFLLAKDEVINSLKEQLSLIKDQLEIKDQQLSRKDEQLSSKDKLLENMQVLLKQEKDNNEVILSLPERIKERDVELVNTLTEVLTKRKHDVEIKSQEKKGFFRFFRGR